MMDKVIKYKVQIDLQAKCRHLEEKLKKLNKETQRVPRKV